MTSPPLYYPGADRKSQWFGPPNAIMPMVHVKWLIHTTESAGGFPGYDGGLEAPSATYEPWLHDWRQHFPINGSTRALENDGSFQTNRADVVQTEISCYCNPALYKVHGHAVNDLDGQAIDDLAAFAAWLHTEWGMALRLVPKPWPPYPASAGLDNGIRLSITGFTGFSGILGHEHAPGQDHGDPGSIAIETILGRAKALVAGAGGARWPAAIAYPGLARTGWGLGRTTEANLLAQAALVVRGYRAWVKDGISKTWTKDAQQALDNYQTHHVGGTTAIDERTWDQLMTIPDHPAEGFPGVDQFQPGQATDASLVMQAALILGGYAPELAQQATRMWRPRAKSATRTFQLAHTDLASDADGVPGPLTWQHAMTGN